MKRPDPQITSIAAQLVARLELERSLGVHHLRLRQSVNIVGAASAADSSVAPVTDKKQVMESLYAQVAKCTACGLHKNRCQVLFGEGAFDADLVFVDKPLAVNERAQGRSFDGQAGQMLRLMIEQGLEQSCSSVYICNLLKCNLLDDQEPSLDEMRACALFLDRQLAIIQPRVIVAIGNSAGGFLSGQQASMTELCGRWWEYNGIPLRVIYHPMYLIQEREKFGRGNPADRKTMDDLRAIKRMLNYELVV